MLAELNHPYVVGYIDSFSACGLRVSLMGGES